MIGFDYGTKPHVAVTCDYEFLEPLQQGMTALGYGEAYHPESDQLVPALMLLFERDSEARRAFSYFSKWIDRSGPKSVRVTLYDTPDGGYELSVSPDISCLVNRTFPSQIRPWIRPLASVAFYRKRFERRSQGYEWFRSNCAGAPVLLTPATPAGSLDELSVLVEGVHVFSENEIPHDIPVSGRKIEDPHQEKISELFGPPSCQEVTEQREKRLRTLFPVTLERLRLCKPDWLENASDYVGWQVAQAVCNLTLERRFPGVLSGAGIEGIGEVMPLTVASAHPEEPLAVSNDFIRSLTTNEVTDQIGRDELALAKHLPLDIEAEGDIRYCLRTYGYLRAEALG